MERLQVVRVSRRAAAAVVVAAIASTVVATQQQPSTPTQTQALEAAQRSPLTEDQKLTQGRAPYLMQCLHLESSRLRARGRPMTALPGGGSDRVDPRIPRHGSGRSSTPSTTAKIVVAAPMPSATVRPGMMLRLRECGRSASFQQEYVLTRAWLQHVG
jgi:hypothetical protein